MKHPIYLALLIFFTLCISIEDVHATHNRAGEITYEQIGDLTIRATITTYTKASSIQADRDTLIMDWGDGTTSTLGRVNGGGNGVVLPGDLQLNIYVGEHTYPGRSTYTMSVLDPNRISNILNINNSNSVLIRFYLEATLSFFNPQFQGYNSSAILLQPPIDQGCVGQRFVHNPNAYDPDGDSLSFELVTPLEDENTPVPDYVLPDRVAPGANNQISFNPATGEFVWLSPQRSGEYNIAIRVNEYRNGTLINTLIRDMQINIETCENRPPEVLVDDRICVVAGEQIDLPVQVIDPDNPELVRVSASGGPFLINPSPAQLAFVPGYQSPAIDARFIWDTRCEHIADPDYQVVFKGEDDEFVVLDDTTGLVDLKSLLIHISGPPPLDVQAESLGDIIRVSWEAPYACEVTTTDYWRGFTVWRSLRPQALDIDTCGMDLESLGYEAIAFQVMDNDDRYFYDDRTVDKGVTYCYRITAEFSQLSPGGNPFNRVQSLSSDEICLQIDRNLPIITHVTVDTTDLSTGQVTVRWLPPLAADLDTIDNPPPYQYRLLWNDGLEGSSFVPIDAGDLIGSTFDEIAAIDSFVHTPLNTVSDGHRYALTLLVDTDRRLIDTSQDASSIFLSATGLDNRVDLSWAYDVPWFVRDHVIFREEPGSSNFIALDTVAERFYQDRDVTNDMVYRYRVQSIGEYGLVGDQSPYINYSQIISVVPVDSIPPCTPRLTLVNNCDDAMGGEPDDQLINQLLWTFDQGCEDTVDILDVRLELITFEGGDTILIAQSDDGDIRDITHSVGDQELGCYLLTLTDKTGNISQSVEEVCAEVCPNYSLPNAFTPNDDGANDVFGPYPYRFVERVDFKAYTRWGNLVFETTNPDILWDGRDVNGDRLPEDVYYFVCDVFARGVDGQIQRFEQLKGNISLIID